MDAGCVRGRRRQAGACVLMEGQHVQEGMATLQRAGVAAQRWAQRARALRLACCCPACASQASCDAG